MPITLPEGLQAAAILRAEGIEVRRELRRTAAPTLGRPLEVALVNLMPRKVATETQFARLLGATPHPLRLTLVVPDGYRPRNTPAEHLERFYQRFREIAHRRFDGLVVTGAPVETLDFEAVVYWEELTRIMRWAAATVSRSLYVCWAAQAALWHHHGVPKHALERKRFGVFTHRLRQREAPAMRGFDPFFNVPVSRHTEVREADLPAGRGLAVLADSQESGLALVEDAPLGALYMFNHLEYDADTLDAEYRRDLQSGLEPHVPAGYYPGDDPARPPVNTWRHGAHLLVRNWVRAVAEERVGRRGDRARSWRPAGVGAVSARGTPPRGPGRRASGRSRERSSCP